MNKKYSNFYIFLNNVYRKQLTHPFSFAHGQIIPVENIVSKLLPLMDHEEAGELLVGEHLDFC